VHLAPDCIQNVASGGIFAVALFLLYRLRAKWTVAAVVALAGVAGFFLFGMSP
jgi:hypothetical protein